MLDGIDEGIKSLTLLLLYFGSVRPDAACKSLQGAGKSAGMRYILLYAALIYLRLGMGPLNKSEPPSARLSHRGVHCTWV